MKVPKRLDERLEKLERATDLIDGCKYILTLAEGWVFIDGGYSKPVKSIKEALDFLRYETVKEK